LFERLIGLIELNTTVKGVVQMRRRQTNDNVILEMLKKGCTQREIAQHFGVSDNAISKRVKRILPPPESLQRLTDKERKFALEVAGGATQTQAAMNAFDVTSRDSAKVMGSQLMNKPDIKIAVNEIMQQEGLTRRYRVRKLKGHVDHTDPNVSLKALDQSWKLDGAYLDRHVHLHMTREEYDAATKRIEEIDEELVQHGFKVVKIDGEVVEAGEMADSEDNGEDVELETD